MGIGLLFAFAPVIFIEIFVFPSDEEKALQVLTDIVRAESEHISHVIDNSYQELQSLAQREIAKCDENALNTIKNAIFLSLYIKNIEVIQNGENVLCDAMNEKLIIRDNAFTLDLNDDKMSLRFVEPQSHTIKGLVISAKLDQDHDLIGFIPANMLLLSALKQIDDNIHYHFLLLFNDKTVIAQYPDYSKNNEDIWSGSQLVKTKFDIQGTPFVIHASAPTAVLLKGAKQINIHIRIIVIIISIGVFIMFAFAALYRPTRLGKLKRAILRREIIAYYQPIINITDGDIVGCEALMRWQRKDGSIILPIDFIDIAEKYDLAVMLSTVLMERVRDDLEEIYSINRRLKVGINLFSDQIEDMKTVDLIKKIFKNSKILMSQLVFEITERAPISDLDQAQKVVRELQSLGCSVALDDMGTGHNGLTYLLKLEADIFKLDKIFIDGITQTGFSSAVVQSMIDMAARLNMDIVAEGIESEDQYKILREMGASHIQGYWISRPLPTAQYILFLKEQKNTFKQQYILPINTN